MTASTTDIANKALTRIGVRTPDNAVDAAILEQVRGSLTDLYSSLFTRRVVKWDLDSIPDDSVGLMVDELAWYIRDDFSLPDSKKQSLQIAQASARGDLYELASIPDNGEPAEMQGY